MATTATLITLVGKPFPFIGVGVPAAQLITPIPSAEFVFSSILGTITVAAAGEDQSLLVNCFLPRSFCWVMVECVFQITSANGANWDNEALMRLQDGSSLPDMVIPMVGRSSNLSHESSALTVRTYGVRIVPNKLIIPQGIDDGLFSTLVSNTTIDGAAGTLMFFARFLRYDRIQAQHWQVNTPQLIR